MRPLALPFLATLFFVSAGTVLLSGCGGGSHTSPAPDVPAPAAGAAAHYSVTALGILPGYSYSAGAALNSRGQVVGTCNRSAVNANDLPITQYRAFLYTGGKMQDLGVPDGYVSSTGDGIDEAGDIIVNTEAPNSGGLPHRQPFLDRNGVLTLIPTAGSTLSGAGISPSGQIAVTAQKTPGHSYGLLFDGQTLQELGLPPGFNYVGIGAPNTAGDLAGTASNADPASNRAVFYHAGTWTNLGTLTGLGGIGDFSSQSSAINASSQITGVSGNETIQHAFLWSQGKMQDLGTLTSGGSSQGNAINDQGVIVGTSTPPYTGAVITPHAFIYAQGQIKDLNDLLPAGSGWVLQSANGINAAGQITGDGLYQGKDQAFLLTPAP